MRQNKSGSVSCHELLAEPLDLPVAESHMQMDPIFMYMAIRPPALASHQKRHSVSANHCLGEIVDKMQEDDVHSAGYPVIISNDDIDRLKEKTRSMPLHTVVWCATGLGFEPLAQDSQEVRVTELTQLIKDEKIKPSVVMMVLQFGARKAAQELYEAGVPLVIWLQAPFVHHIYEHSDLAYEFFFKVIRPLLRDIADDESYETMFKKYQSELDKLVLGRDGHHLGCFPEELHRQCCLNHLFKKRRNPVIDNCMPAVPCSNLMNTLPHSRWVDHDDMVSLRTALGQRQGPKWWLIVPVSEQKARTRKHEDRLRGIVHDACAAFLCHGSAAKIVYRLAAACEVEDFKREMNRCRDAMSIVWIDLAGGQDIQWAAEALSLCCNRAECRVVISGGELPDDLVDEFDLDVANFKVTLQETEDLGSDTPEPLHDSVRLSVGNGATENIDLLQEDIHRIIVQHAQRHLCDQRTLAALYEDENHCVALKFNICSIKHLQQTRDLFLSGGFQQSLKDELLQHHGFTDISVTVDMVDFVHLYERCLLQLENLTEKQKAVVKRFTASDESCNLHLKGPGGSGKTFVALHMILDWLRAPSSAETFVILVTSTEALAIFVIAWMRARLRGQSKKRMESRFHLLIPPFNSGPKQFRVENDQTVKLEQAHEAEKYGLVFVDEAHHIFHKDTAAAEREAVQKHIRAVGARSVIISDSSQAKDKDIAFPPVDQEEILDEIVRCTERIVSAAAPMQAGNAEFLTCHSVNGPPLKSYIFDADSANRFQCYAEYTSKAIRFIKDSYKGLSLGNRLALLVPDAEFKGHFMAELHKELGKEGMPFDLVDAQTSAQWMLWRQQMHTPEVLVLDTVDAFDGMERLMVICVGLDQLRDINSARRTRSIIYRAMTRAQMLVIAVNEALSGGWLDFLRGIKLGSGSEEKKFVAGAAGSHLEHLVSITTTAAGAALSPSQREEPLPAGTALPDSTVIPAGNDRPTGDTALPAARPTPAGSSAAAAKALQQERGFIEQGIWDPSGNDTEEPVLHGSFMPFGDKQTKRTEVEKKKEEAEKAEETSQQEEEAKETTEDSKHETKDFPNGDRYVGPLKDGKMHGDEGTYYYADGRKYVGPMKDDKMHGDKGTLYYSDGKIQYVGPWKDGKPHGEEGTEYYPNGGKYVGPFKDGEFIGNKGPIYTSEGSNMYNFNGDIFYVGSIKDGRQHGKGTEYDGTGKARFGRWSNGRLIEWLG
eukprot:TRINITY_DN10670_c0_g1_i4.p1 TRINITY_DN10670_c0_g1~~TRINITY_DN10670_c0_g1_i4.p1  ORF type:complete len:1418 (+),score=320.03 TRINITY_DN10670_c0_g1_i4:584-4255(+)